MKVFRVMLAKSTCITVNVRDDFDPRNTAHQFEFEQAVDDQIKAGLDWGDDKHILVNAVYSNDFTEDELEELVE